MRVTTSCQQHAFCEAEHTNSCCVLTMGQQLLGIDPAACCIAALVCGHTRSSACVSAYPLLSCVSTRSSAQLQETCCSPTSTSQSFR
jgi:hypothetical protein